MVREDSQDPQASFHLIRLMQYEVEQQIQASKQLDEKMLGSSSSLFDQVRKSV